MSFSVDSFSKVTHTHKISFVCYRNFPIIKEVTGKHYPMGMAKQRCQMEINNVKVLNT
jgi:hypothetical protein